MLMNFTFYGNRIKPKEEMVVTFQEIRKIKYSLNANTSFYQICCIVCRSEMKLDLLRRRCFNMADGVSMFDRMWLSLINQRVLDLLLLLYSFVKLSPVLRESNQNSFQEETKSRFKPRNACYHSVKNLLPLSLLSRLLPLSLLSRNLKIKNTEL